MGVVVGNTMNWLTVVMMWCSVVVGWILAIAASEELVVGRRYFEWLRLGLFFSVLILFSYFMFNNFGIFSLVLLLLGIGLAIIHLFLKKISFWKEVTVDIFIFLWATMVILVWGNQFVDLGLLFVSLLFIYGLVVGTLGKMVFDANKV